MRKMKKYVAWAIVDRDGDVPSLNHPNIGDFYHINTHRKDAQTFVDKAKIKDTHRIVRVEIRPIAE